MSDKFTDIFQLRSVDGRQTEIHLHRVLPNRVASAILGVLLKHATAQEESTPLPDAPWLRLVVDNREDEDAEDQS